jgi:hypothetical protein
MAPIALTRGLIICGLAGLAMPFPEITSDGTNVQILAPSGDITVRGQHPSRSLTFTHTRGVACPLKKVPRVR